MTPRFWSGLSFVALNLWCTRRLPAAPENVVASGIGAERLVVRTLAEDDIECFRQLHDALRPHKPLSLWRRWLYRRAGGRLVWLVKTGDGACVGCTMHYFRGHEWARGIVHEAFIGVASGYRGRRLADTMRAHAGDYFARAGLAGISTQIDPANLPSLRSAERQGFQEVAVHRGKVQLVRRFEA